MKRYLTWLGILAVTAFVSMGTIVTPEVVLVDPTADLQDAVDNLDATAGGEIRLGPGTFQLSSTLRLDRPVKMVGSGQYSTFIEMDNPDSNVVEVLAGAVVIRDLTLQVATSSIAAGSGVGLMLKNYSSAAMSDNVFENIRVQHTGSWGVKLCGQTSLEAPDSSVGDIVAPQFNRVIVYDCKSGGAVYSGVGVAAPHFSDCIFVAQGYTPAGSYSWKWQSVIPAYADYPDTTSLQIGEVYLYNTFAAVFRNCSFELSGSATDTPVLTIENSMMTRLDGCYFEAGGARTQPFVTLSAAAAWSFRDTYVYSPSDAPLKFMVTNTHPSSNCSGVIDGFLALHGSTSAAVDTSDFRFSSVDATQRGNIVLRDVNIYNNNGRGFRDLSVLQGSGTSVFHSQGVLLQNSSRRFSVPRLSADSLADLGQLKRGEMAYVSQGSGMSGGLGKLLVVTDNNSLSPIPILPLVADTAAASALYTAVSLVPREGDLCYTTGDHKLKIYNGTAWEALH